MRRVVLIAAVAALMLAACGTEAVDGEGNGPPPVAEETATLADYLPMGPRDEAEAQEHFQQQERLVQESVRTCMAEQGFEYIPYVPNFEEDFFFDDFDEEEWAAQHGFGMASWLLEEPDFEGDEEWDPYDDPNYAITEAMTETEQEAYYHALYGDEPDMSAFEEFDWENATEEEIEEMNRLEYESWMNREWKGCMDLAWEEVQGGEEIWMSFDEAFGDTMWEEVNAKVEADPRIIELEAEWQTCMAEAGYDWPDEMTMHDDLYQEFEAIVTWPEEGAGNGPTVTTAAPPFYEVVEQEDGSVIYIDEFGNELTEEQVWELEEQMWRPQFDEAELRAFFDREIEVAVASVRCTGDRWEIYREVSEEYENEWVAENKAALDAWKAGLESDA